MTSSTPAATAATSSVDFSLFSASNFPNPMTAAGHSFSNKQNISLEASQLALWQYLSCTSLEEFTQKFAQVKEVWSKYANQEIQKERKAIKAKYDAEIAAFRVRELEQAKSFSAQQKTINMAMQTITPLKEKIEALEAALENRKNLCATLRKENEAYAAKEKDHFEQLKRMHARIRELDTELKKSNKQVETLNGQITQLRNQLHAKQNLQQKK